MKREDTEASDIVRFCYQYYHHLSQTRFIHFGANDLHAKQSITAEKLGVAEMFLIDDLIIVIGFRI